MLYDCYLEKKVFINLQDFFYLCIFIYLYIFINHSIYYSNTVMSSLENQLISPFKKFLVWSYITSGEALMYTASDLEMLLRLFKNIYLGDETVLLRISIVPWFFVVVY